MRATRGVSRRRLVATRFRRRRLTRVAVAGLAVLVLAAYLLPLVSRWTPADQDWDYTQSLTGPGVRHWFGTDQIGHDLFAQTMSGLQKSMLIGLVAAILSTGVAAVVGSVAGYLGGWTERITVLAVDLLMVLPSFLIVAIISPALRGGGFVLLALLLAAFNWMITARVVRGLARGLRDREYVEAARAMGVGAFTVIGRHILPDIASLLIVAPRRGCGPSPARCSC
ncbi:ABC transporter permease [Nonomuraea pusilla]|uniref:ABC transporter permease n=1 Tax=Nonomuraea pusilla TaxID=46177 RepID=UPI003319406A